MPLMTDKEIIDLSNESDCDSSSVSRQSTFNATANRNNASLINNAITDKNIRDFESPPNKIRKVSLSPLADDERKPSAVVELKNDGDRHTPEFYAKVKSEVKRKTALLKNIQADVANAARTFEGVKGGVPAKEVKLVSKFIMETIEKIPREEYESSCVYTLGVGKPDFSSDMLKKNIECYLSSGSRLFFMHFLEGGYWLLVIVKPWLKHIIIASV